MKKTTIKVDTVLLKLKMKEKGIDISSPKRTGISLTAHLTLSEKDRLEKLAEYRHMRLNDLVNMIIKTFEFDWNDIKFFHGLNKRSLTDTVKTFFAKPEEKVYVTFEVKKEQAERIGGFRNKYDMLRGKILTHMIKKYLKQNL